ncbi:preprotein translocase SecA [Catellatospora methionotrophica]|uniref:Preprotein translocase SecA n=1 Tax=Catellatospora methionotrophica TaxID=121620 RepID=A0A8J3L8A1_9ACTN|nr:DUF5926 family protein [Catellatospora methionotrophica]GIG14075.1 preprotein translocase SecA [Catellatospora methionotrophica]
MSKKNRLEKKQQPKQPKVRDVFVARPFDGLAAETELVALRELVPAATAPLTLAPEYVEKYGDRQVVLATILPMAWPALTKTDGRILLGLQRHERSGDVNRDLAVALLCALEGEPGAPVNVPPLPGEGPRLADLLVNAPLDVTVYDGFDFWLDADQERDAEVSASLDAANASVYPTVRMAAAPSAYWCRVPEKSHVRWVLPDSEDVALNALARLSAAGELKLTEQTKFAGMFRAHGLLVPVWDLPSAPEAGDWEEPLAAVATRYAAAKAVDAPLTQDERRARQGLLGRQLTLR